MPEVIGCLLYKYNEKRYFFNAFINGVSNKIYFCSRRLCDSPLLNQFALSKLKT